MKYLKEKNEFKYTEPRLDILDTFDAPRDMRVGLTAFEVTSLCPVTGQPDYHTVTISYKPNNLCLESKSLKLYLGSFRNYGTFTEHLCSRIWKDLMAVLSPKNLKVHIRSASRGGISVEAERRTK